GYSEISHRSGTPSAGRQTAVWRAVGSGTLCTRQSFQDTVGTSRSSPALAGSGLVPPDGATAGNALPPSVWSPAVRYTTPAAVSAASPTTPTASFQPNCRPGRPKNISTQRLVDGASCSE